VCVKIVDPRVTSLSEEGQGEFAKKLASLLEKEGVALDAGAYRAAPPGLRFWCGATVEASDVEAVIPWIEWAFGMCVSELGARAA
jgi:phosphoserine aminotransferase